MTLQSEGKNLEDEMETLQEEIHLITKYQKPYIANSLKRMAQKSSSNAKVICDYIIADGFLARPLIINFPNQFLGEKANPYLIEELTTPEEMSGLLSLILKRLPRVLKNGISTKSTIEDNYIKYMQSSDPIRLFAEMAIKTVVSDSMALFRINLTSLLPITFSKLHLLGENILQDTEAKNCFTNFILSLLPPFVSL